jgi:hypothetical protein
VGLTDRTTPPALSLLRSGAARRWGAVRTGADRMIAAMACIPHGLEGRLNPSSPAAARTEMLEEFLWTSGGYSRLETTDPSRPCRSARICCLSDLLRASQSPDSARCGLAKGEQHRRQHRQPAGALDCSRASDILHNSIFRVQSETYGGYVVAT